MRPKSLKAILSDLILEVGPEKALSLLSDLNLPTGPHATIIEIVLSIRVLHELEKRNF